MRFPDWCRDLPTRGTRFAAGDPVCTVHATGVRCPTERWPCCGVGSTPSAGRSAGRPREAAMRIFASEFFSGGGLLGQPLPPSLAREGDLMLGTLVGELAGIEGVHVIASRDPRLPPLAGCETLYPLPGEQPGGALRPRGGGGGRRLADRPRRWRDPRATCGDRPSRRADAAGMHPGSGSPGGQQAGHCPSARRARRSGGAHLRCGEHRPVDPRPLGREAGRRGRLRGPRAPRRFGEAEGRLRSAAGRLVAQPWIEAEAWSLSLLCAGGRARLLGCNRQRLSWRAGRLHLDAIAVNARPPGDPRVHRLGAEVAAAIPGLWGYVGVDFLLGAEGPLVLEVNPRLTTSYCALPAALGRNVAAMVLELRRSGELPAQRPWSGKVVELALQPEYAA